MTLIQIIVAGLLISGVTFLAIDAIIHKAVTRLRDGIHHDIEATRKKIEEAFQTARTPQSPTGRELGDLFRRSLPIQSIDYSSGRSPRVDPSEVHRSIQAAVDRQEKTEPPSAWDRIGGDGET